MVGERLSDLRKDKGLTQKELADKLNLAESTISSYERDLTSPDDDMKIRIARFFNVSLDYLLGLTTKQTPLDETTSGVIVYTDITKNTEREILEFFDELRTKKKLK